MTVAELIGELQKMPQSAVVLYPGDRDGWEEAGDVERAVMAKGYFGKWQDGDSDKATGYAAREVVLVS